MGFRVAVVSGSRVFLIEMSQTYLSSLLFQVHNLALVSLQDFVRILCVCVCVRTYISDEWMLTRGQGVGF